MIDAVGNPQSILLLGGTSEIGLAVVEAFASDRPLRVVLAARPSPRLDEAARPAGEARRAVETARVRREGARHARRRGRQGVRGRRHRRRDRGVRAARRQRAGLDRTWTTAVELAQVNYTAAVSVGVALGERMKAQGHGAIVALSSVAGERARRSNFVYGSTKAGHGRVLLRPHRGAAPVRRARHGRAARASCTRR